MSGTAQPNLTQLLAAMADGESSARERLWALVYDELRRVAHHQMKREAHGRGLQTTVLVHEAYLRLSGDGDANWSNRAHFFAAAAEAMRRICVDDARRRGRKKRGSGRPIASLDAEPAVFDADHDEVLAIDEVLDELAAIAPRQAEIAKLRYFAGLTVAEAADVLGVSPRTVDNEWRFARAWLYKKLGPDWLDEDSG